MRELIYSFSILFLLVSCGGAKVEKSPVDKMKDEFGLKTPYSILLWDMDLKEDVYYHKYVVATKINDSIVFDKTDWEKVSHDFFELNRGNLGMEILGLNIQHKYNNLPTPPGFTNIIGDRKFGDWKHQKDTMNKVYSDKELSLYGNKDSIIWEFNQKNMHLKSELGIDSLTVFYTHYVDFKNKYELVKPYYAEDKQRNRHHYYYGTGGWYWHRSRPDFYRREKQTKGFYSPKNNSRSGSSGYRRGGGGYGK